MILFHVLTLNSDDDDHKAATRVFSVRPVFDKQFQYSLL